MYIYIYIYIYIHTSCCMKNLLKFNINIIFYLFYLLRLTWWDSTSTQDLKVPGSNSTDALT